MSTRLYERAPARVYWELTRACALACRHCRAEAVTGRSPNELSTEECRRVLDDLATANPLPHVVLTGGDPLQRPDLLDIIGYGVACGLPIALAPSATEALTAEAVAALRGAGVSAMSLSLDGSSAARHDELRGVPGCFAWTVAAARRVRAAGIALQVNTLVTAETAADLDRMPDLLRTLDVQRWSLFFLIPTGRGRSLTPLSAKATETLLGALAERAAGWPFVLTTTEAPHFRRIAVQRMKARGLGGDEIRKSPLARAFGLRDGNGIMFISATGDVSPSGFLPVAVGNVREASPLALYRETPVFRTLREPDRLEGRCGVCEYRMICGGSRARAWAVSGELLAEDPLCAWSPEEE